jgi:hypothetical protein
MKNDSCPQCRVYGIWSNIRSGDDDLSVNKLLVKSRVLAVLVGGGDKGVALVLEPFANTKLVLGGSEKLGNLIQTVGVSSVSLAMPKQVFKSWWGAWR